MYEVIQIKLREAGKVSYFSTSCLRPAIGECCIVESDRGLDYGFVVSEPEVILDADVEEPLRKIIRAVTPHDKAQIDKNKIKAKEAFHLCQKKVQERGIDMKLIDAEYSFDLSKIVFYFTAEGRVDFRELVKELANIFKARIELKQIGVRDEAKLLGGFGHCGRQLCCARFLKDFEPVTIKMAKEQNLPLNPAKISGLCGRLMCCLGYEYNTYKCLMKDLPKEGEKVKIKDISGKVLSVNAITRKLLIETEDGRQIEVKYDGECRKNEK